MAWDLTCFAKIDAVDHEVWVVPNCYQLFSYMERNSALRVRGRVCTPRHSVHDACAAKKPSTFANRPIALILDVGHLMGMSRSQGDAPAARQEVLA